jgi:hypothetical protein
MHVQMQDISYQVFGKYVHCTMHDGLWWSDDDFGHGYGVGELNKGAIPCPRQDTPELTERAKSITEAGGWAGPPEAPTDFSTDLIGIIVGALGVAIFGLIVLALVVIK